MKNYKTILFILSSIFLWSCSESPSESDYGSIQGYLLFKGVPVSDVNVQIDEILNLRTQTANDGYFEIHNIPTGSHVLKSVHATTNGQTTSIESEILVGEGVNEMGEIRLPVPSLMFEPHENEVGINLSWSKSTDVEFREYKIYRRDSPGLDELTGELVFVTTSREDTTFLDEEYINGETYYYRTFTLSAFGKVGGSNLVSVETEVPNLVKNGSFEDSDEGSAPSHWSFWGDAPENGLPGSVVVDITKVIDGEKSLRMFIPDYPDMASMGDFSLNQSLNSSDFIAGKTYRLSLSVYPRDLSMGGYILDGNNNLVTEILSTSVKDEWSVLSTDFNFPSVSGILTLRIYAEVKDADIELSSWVDNVRIELVQ